MSDRESRRKRRIERRQREILDAAAHIFAERGYRDATTKEIAEAVDIAEGTLYHYYSGKREILVSILKETAKDAQNAPSFYAAFNFINDGRLLVDHYISTTRFKNIINKEIKS